MIATKVIIGMVVVVLLMGFLAGVIALAFVRDYQKYRRNGE